MAELEQLRALAAELEWPEAPDFAARLELVPRRARRRRRALVVALAAALLAVAVAMAVPPARSAILRLFHIGGVTGGPVSTLPPAEERPLASGLGVPVTAAEARSALGVDFALPRTNDTPTLYRSAGAVSALLAVPEPVLLSEFRSGFMLKKFAASATSFDR